MNATVTAKFGTTARAIQLMEHARGNSYGDISGRAIAHGVIDLAKSISKIAKSLGAIADEQRTANLLKAEELAVHPSRETVPNAPPLTPTEKLIIKRLEL